MALATFLPTSTRSPALPSPLRPPRDTAVSDLFAFRIYVSGFAGERDAFTGAAAPSAASTM